MVNVSRHRSVFWVQPRWLGKVPAVWRFPVFPGLFCCRCVCCSPLYLRFVAGWTASFCTAPCLDVDNVGGPVGSCGGVNDVVKPDTPSSAFVKSRDIVHSVFRDFLFPLALRWLYWSRCVSSLAGRLHPRSLKRCSHSLRHRAVNRVTSSVLCVFYAPS